MQTSVLQLERTFFRKVELTGQLNGAAEPTQEIVTSVSSGRAADNPLRFQVTLGVRLLDTPDKPSGYRGEFEVMGFFKVSDKVAEKDRDRVVAVHGATVLFGMVREMVCNLTARGPWPMITLPTVSFHDLAPIAEPAVAAATQPRTVQSTDE